MAQNTQSRRSGRPRITMGAVFSALALVLAGCTPGAAPRDLQPDPDADLSTCGQPGRAPSQGFIDRIEPLGPLAVPMLRDIRARDGWLFGDAGAEAHLAASLQPLDIVIVSYRQSLIAQVTQGYLSHAALVIGSEAQVQALGLWDAPALAPLRDDIRAGATLIEANGGAVALVTLGAVLNADGAVILRPTGLTLAGRRRAVLRALADLGQPFDFSFDANSPQTVFCTELIDRSLPGADLPRTLLYARQTILPDVIASAALDGTAPLAIIDFVHADRTGWQQGSADLLRATIAANWSDQ